MEKDGGWKREEWGGCGEDDNHRMDHRQCLALTYQYHIILSYIILSYIIDFIIIESVSD